MRIIDYTATQAPLMASFGGRGVRRRSLARSGGVAVTTFHLDAAGEIGEIGRHPAMVDQLFFVVAGSGEVSGADGIWQPIVAGQAAVWRAGEEHSTRTNETLSAVVVEAEHMGLVDRL